VVDRLVEPPLLAAGFGEGLVQSRVLRVALEGLPKVTLGGLEPAGLGGGDPEHLAQRLVDPALGRQVGGDPEGGVKVTPLKGVAGLRPPGSRIERAHPAILGRII
jgi:hypothetical protein